MSTRSELEYLADYNIHNYEIPLTTVDIAIFTVIDQRLQVLLVKRAQHPAMGCWALPGGFIDLRRDASVQDTARRKLEEKTGVDTPYLEQVETVGGCDRDPRGWSVTVVYMALLDAGKIHLRANEQAGELCWTPVDELEKVGLAFDHHLLIERSLARLRARVQYTLLPVNLAPPEFTLTQLQKLYELVLQQKLEKKSFRRRILESGLLEETGETRSAGRRPAKLYRTVTGSEHFLFNRNIEGPRG